MKEAIKNQVANISPTQCMVPAIVELYEGMGAKIDGYEAILERNQLFQSSGDLERISKLTDKRNKYFRNSDIHMELFAEMINDFEN